jgi:hypothetical protein
MPVFSHRPISRRTSETEINDSNFPFICNTLRHRTRRD